MPTGHGRFSETARVQSDSSKIMSEYYFRLPHFELIRPDLEVITVTKRL